MVSLGALWLPIVVSAIVVFVASSVLHMVLKYHQSDYGKMPDEDGVQAAMRAADVAPGHYYVPHCVDPKQLAEPEMRAKFEKGPVAWVTVVPSGVQSMTKPLVSWLVYCIVIGVFVAYLTGRTMAPGADYLAIFRVAGTAALLGHAGGTAGESIWKGLPWSITAKHMLDALVYALLTGGVFGWLWPS